MSETSLLGPRARHARRRRNNPLFPSARREVDMEEMARAQADDEAEYRAVREAFEALLHRVGDMQGREETDTILGLKQDLERLEQRCAGFASRCAKELQALNRLSEIIVSALRAAAGSDPAAMQELDREAQARALHLQLLQFPLVADLLSENSPVAEGELAATLLSSDPDEISAVMSLFDQPQRHALRMQADEMVARIEDGHLRESLAARLAAMQPSMLQ